MTTSAAGVVRMKKNIRMVSACCGGGQRQRRRRCWCVDFGGDGVTRKMAKNGMNTTDYNRKFIGVCSHTTKIVKMTIKSLPLGYVPGRHVYCLTLNPAMSNNTTNCRACGPCVTLCSNASFIYFSSTLIVERMKSALDTVCSIPHMSMPANGTTMTAPEVYVGWESSISSSRDGTKRNELKRDEGNISINEEQEKVLKKCEYRQSVRKF